MKCVNHPEREATGFCSYSGKPFCEEDLVEIDGKNYAKQNLSRVFADAKESIQRKDAPPMVFMNAGGASSSSSSSAAVLGPQSYVHRKSKWVTFLLALFLGFLGAHRFYTGKTFTGFIYLITVGLAGIGWIIDVIRIPFGWFRDSRGEPLA